MPTNRRLFATLAVAAVAALALSGCGLTDLYEDVERDGGQLPADAIAAIEAIDGVSDATFETQSWYNPGEGGLFSSSGMNIVLEIEFEPDVHIDDHASFVGYTTALLWSINDKWPKGSAKIVLDGGVSPNFEWAPATQAALGVAAVQAGERTENGTDEPIDYTDRSAIVVGAQLLGESLGPWPGPAPNAPGGLLAAGAPEVVTPPAITGLVAFARERPGRGSESSGFTEQCWTVQYTLTTTTGGGTYAGDVVVVLMGAAGEIDRMEGDSYSADFCYAEDDLPDELRSGDGIRAEVTALASEGFAGVEESLRF